MILSKNSIRECVQAGLIGIAPFVEENLKDASYTFTLGPTLRRMKGGQVLRVGSKPEYEELAIPKDGYALQPGEFVLGFTKETLSLRGNYACQLSVRGSCAQIGLNALLSDTFAEPDTDGALALAIGNAGTVPVLLEEGMRIVKGVFTPIGDSS